MTVQAGPVGGQLGKSRQARSAWERAFVPFAPDERRPASVLIVPRDAGAPASFVSIDKVRRRGALFAVEPRFRFAFSLVFVARLSRWQRGLSGPTRGLQLPS